MTYLVPAFMFSIGLLVSALIWSEISRWRERKMASGWIEREEYLRRIAASERDLLNAQLDREREMAAAERKELYSRIQAYDPNVGDFTPPSITAPPSRPGEQTAVPRSFTEEELGQMGLVEQADGMIRDTRNQALYETVEDWRFFQEDLRKRGLPMNVHPEAVQELGWEQAVALAKQQSAAKKAAQTKN
jgi:hypothetical protein